MSHAQHPHGWLLRKHWRNDEEICALGQRSRHRRRVGARFSLRHKRLSAEHGRERHHRIGENGGRA